MSTIIRLNNVQFNNADLPVIQPFIRRGLMGAWRFNELGTIQDLSGNGRKLTPIGAPEFGEFGLVARGSMNGYMSDIPDNGTITLIAIARNQDQNPSIPAGGAFYVSNYMPGASSETAERMGVSIWQSGIFDITNDKEQRVGNQIYSEPLTPDDPSTPQNNTYYFNDRETTSDDWLGWQFCALSVDTANNQVISFVSGNMDEPVTNNPSHSIVGRYLKKSNGDENYLHVGMSPNNPFPNNGRVEMIEAMVYHSALTIDEIKEQYRLSKDYFAKVRNIEIR